MTENGYKAKTVSDDEIIELLRKHIEANIAMMDLSPKGSEISEFEKRLDAYGTMIDIISEIQQYRAIETELREKYHANVDIKELMKCFIETIFKQEKHEGFCILTNEDAKMWEEYQAVGTVEECREARERQIGKKPVKDGYNHDCCHNCGWIVYQEEWGGRYLPHCENCGQAIDWSE